MIFLWMFGDNVEDILGKKLFIFAYMSCGLAATYFYFLFNLNSAIPLVGASGAISGVMGLYMVFFRYAHVDLVLAAKNGRYVTVAHLSSNGAILSYLVTQLALWLLFFNKASGIAFGAHVGGLLFGIFLGTVLKLYLNIEPATPKKELVFHRDKKYDIWCPHCGLKERNESRAGTYRCSNCGTRYKIAKSALYPRKPTNEKKVDIKHFYSKAPVFDHNHISNKTYIRKVFSEQGNDVIEYTGYITKFEQSYYVAITALVDNIERLLSERILYSLEDLDRYLRTNSKFILSDFEI
mgnify:FL=1